MTFAMGSIAYIGLAVTSHNSSTAAAATFDNVTTTGWPPLPGAPNSLAATAGDAQVALSWAAATGASSYNVKSATNSGGTFTTFTNVTTTNCVNAGLFNGTTYFYVVSALNISGESTNSVQASAMLAEVSPNLILTPTSSNFTFSWPVSASGFTLQSTTNLADGSWTAVTSAVPQNIGGQWVLTLPVPTNAEPCFYRLAK